MDYIKMTERDLELCKEIGIYTVEDLGLFIKQIVGKEENLSDALERHRKELGPKFKIKESIWNTDPDTDNIKHLNSEQEARIYDVILIEENEEIMDAYFEGDQLHVIIVNLNTTDRTDYEPRLEEEQIDYIMGTLKEDKYYLSKEDAANDYVRLAHFLSVNGYSEIPYTIYGTTADKTDDETAATVAKDDNALISSKSLGYIGIDREDMLTVTAGSKENLEKAREIAADFDCPVERELTRKDPKSGANTYTIVINPYCGYEYGTDECQAAIDKYTPDNQKVYDKRAEERRAKRGALSTLADATDDILSDLVDDEDLGESYYPENEDDDGYRECVWCMEEYPIEELYDSEIGLVCDRCLRAVESREGPIASRKHVEEGCCKKEGCECEGEDCETLEEGFEVLGKQFNEIVNEFIKEYPEVTATATEEGTQDWEDAYFVTFSVEDNIDEVIKNLNNFCENHKFASFSYIPVPEYKDKTEYSVLVRFGAKERAVKTADGEIEIV